MSVQIPEVQQLHQAALAQLGPPDRHQGPAGHGWIKLCDLMTVGNKDTPPHQKLNETVP
jgi:hypothetical protein